MSRIKVILWDIDGTLLNFKEAEEYAIKACFSQFDIGLCSEEMLAEYSLINQSYWQQLERGEITKKQVFEGRFHEFFTNHQIDTSIIPMFNQEFQIQLGNTVRFNDNSYELVMTLRDKVKQYAVTNGSKIAQKRKLAKSGLAEIFDDIFISEEVGIEKPMPGFFDAVWNQIGNYQKNEVMIVGDSLTSDMQGGNNAGILCCWYNPQKTPNTSNLKIDYEITSLTQIPDLITG